MREFHVRRTARERYAIDDALLGARGDLVVADLAAIRHLAARMNSVRPAGAPSVGAGEIVALGLLHEVAHLLTARFEALGARRDGRRPSATSAANSGTDADLVLDRFAAAFPGVGPEPEPPLVRLEELLLTRIANENPAIGPLRELVDDRVLREGTRYDEVIAGLERASRREGRRSSSRTGPGPRSSSCCGRRPDTSRPRSPASCATSASTGARSSGPTSTRSSAGWTSRSGSSPRRSTASTSASVVAGAARTARRTCRRSPAVVDEPEAFSSDSALDAARRADGEEHLRLARPAVAPPRPRACGRSTRSRTRSSTRSRAGASRPVADRAVAALGRVGADQADARQPRRRRLGLLARRLPDRRRPRRRGGLREPARSGVGARDPPGQRHGAQPHGHRFALGHRAPGVVPVAARAAVPRLHLHRAGPVARSARRDRARGPLLGRHRRRRRVQARSTARPATSATSITATTARASPGTTRPSSTSCRPTSAST